MGPGPFAFVDGALDRADALRDDPAALRALWPSARIVVIDGEGATLVGPDGALHAPAPCEASLHAGIDGFDEAVFLGLRDGEAWFAAGADTTTADQPRMDLRSAAGTWPAFESTVFAQARAVLHWRRRHRFCPACAGALRFERAGWLGRCTLCGVEQYPRTDPAVIVAVSDGPRLLMGRQANWPARRYSVLAGFVEPGESLEQAIVREVLEESAVRVRASRYLGSQPWPFPGSLMLGFIADAEPDEPRCSPEHEDVRWFGRDEIGAALRGETGDSGLLLSPSLSISRWLVARWHDAGPVPG